MAQNYITPRTEINAGETVDAALDAELAAGTGKVTNSHGKLGKIPARRSERSRR